MTLPGVDTSVDVGSVDGMTVRKLSQGGTGKTKRDVRTMDGLVGSAVFGVHNPSLVNLKRGVAERVLYTRTDKGLATPIRPVKGVFDRLRHIKSLIVGNTCPTNVVAMEDYPSLYHDARKRAVYTKACESLRSVAVNVRDSIVNTFVKAEKINLSSKPDPAPRVIQPRSARYNVCVGRYLKPFESALVKGFKKAFGYSVITKGLNAIGVASQLRRNWDEFVDPVAFGLDASRFDQHVSIEALRYEHSVYNSIFNSTELAGLLKWQLHNKGVAYCDGHKLKYSVDGCRMSGDINTGMGNCLIMSSIVLAYFELVGVRARLSNNGDDCVVFCERRDYAKFAGIGEWFREFGFKLTREPVTDVFEKIEFCQTQPVLCSDGWRMVRNPYVASSKDMVSLLSWSTECEWRRWAGAIGKCGLSLTQGVPYWEAFYRRFVGVEHETTYNNIMQSGLGYLARGMHSTAEVTPESRYSFWLAFGMLPDHQEALEQVVVDVGYSELTPMMYGNTSMLSDLLQNA